MALTMKAAPEVGFTRRRATIGLMTLSLALTVALEVVAASHRIDSCCVAVSPEVDVVLLFGVVVFPANGRKGIAAADILDFFFGDSNFRSWSIVACFLPHLMQIGRWVHVDARCPGFRQ